MIDFCLVRYGWVGLVCYVWEDWYWKLKKTVFQKDLFIKNNLVKQILVKKSVSGSDLEKVVNCPQAENLEIYNVTTKDNHKS